ncbi:Synaptonemal complex protein 1 [Myotis davidii]|uniref:Synaptonemal complex protein 1 n=1 Tax=Myotis davidii TaxID=225400 RepID=L5LMJ9_MYODS|nr:Synaptonemal complex protein 1 [Myotis davidii]
MEKQKPFTSFVPPRVSSSQVSAVKPRTLGGESNFFKSFNKDIEDGTCFPFAMTNLSKHGKNIDSDATLQKVNFLPVLEQNSEPMRRLNSKLYKEVEKIKKWKVNIGSEPKQKENKLQENRKIVEAQRKAIQELQVCPGRFGSADRAAASGLKSPGIDSSQGHRPGLQARSPGGGVQEAADQ